MVFAITPADKNPKRHATTRPDPYRSYWCGDGKDGRPFKNHAPCHDAACECACHTKGDLA